MKRSRGKILPLAAIGLAAAMLFALGIFLWWRARDCVRVSLGYEYFLLVRPCEESTAAAVIGESYSAGGAALAYGDDQIVLACYDTRSAAERICENMASDGTQSEVVRIASSEFFMYGSAAAYAPLAKANAATADSVARLLYDTANSLERSEIGQTEAVSALKGAAASLKGLREGNGGVFEAWDRFLYRTESEARAAAGGIVFAKDIRRIQISLCIAVASIEEFL